MDETIQRASGIGEWLGRADRERKIQEARELIASGSWREAVKEYGRRVLVNPYIPPASLERIVTQLSAIDMVVPDDVLEASRGNKNLVRLLSGTRGSMLVRMAEAMGTTAWEEMLRGGSEAYAGMTQISQSTDLSCFRSPFLERLRVQESLEIDGSEDEGTSTDVRVFLDATGFLGVARHTATKIRIGPNRERSIGSGEYELPTGQLIVRSHPDYRRFVPGILMHEAGHGLHAVLAGFDRGQEWFERYAADVVLRPETASSYADSFIASDETILSVTNGRLGVTFLQESFAEDFMHYWLDQDRVPSARRHIFDEIADTVFPSVDRENLRANIRQFMRQTYHVSPAEVIPPDSCEISQILANDRIKEARENAEKHSARPAVTNET